MNEIENKPMTIREALDVIIKNLGSIPVPVEQFETVTLPIAREIRNLQNICAVMDKEEQKQAEENDIHIDLDIVPEEEHEDA
jgi:hypothetical protein